MTQKDYTNPSYRKSNHPSFSEKKHTIVVDAQGASNKTIATESGNLKFENGVAVLPNDERARDMGDELNGSSDPNGRALHPNQYALVENKPTVNVDPIHRYRFGFNRKFAEEYDRIFRQEDEPVEDEIEVQEDTDGERPLHRPDSDTQCCTG